MYFCTFAINGCLIAYFGHVEEYIGLDDNKYIGDLLAEFKAAKDRSKGEILHCKLVFKKKLFRESDEAITDQMFAQLSYVQVCDFTRIWNKKNLGRCKESFIDAVLCSYNMIIY